MDEMARWSEDVEKLGEGGGVLIMMRPERDRRNSE